MYSDKPINQTMYSIEKDFLEVCPYFDKQFYHSKFENGGPFKNQTSYFGGFGLDDVFCISSTWHRRQHGRLSSHLVAV